MKFSSPLCKKNTIVTVRRTNSIKNYRIKRKTYKGNYFFQQTTFSALFLSLRVNESTSQRVNKSTSQQVNESTSQRVNEPTSQRGYEPTSQRANESTSQQVNEATSFFVGRVGRVRQVGQVGRNRQKGKKNSTYWIWGSNRCLIIL